LLPLQIPTKEIREAIQAIKRTSTMLIYRNVKRAIESVCGKPDTIVSLRLTSERLTLCAIATAAILYAIWVVLILDNLLCRFQAII
ncbi:unnamed protein product, partial [marine sediment metagenome]